MAQTITRTRWGPRIVAVGPWTRECTTLARQHSVAHVVLNPWKGWKPTDLRFLHDLPSLRYLEIYTNDDNDISPIQELTHLEGLSLTAYGSKRFSFAHLTSLRKLWVVWKPAYSGLEACRHLEDVGIMSYSRSDLTELSASKGITKLRLICGSVKRLGPLVFPSLHALQLARVKSLEDLGEISSLTGLTYLEISGRSKVPSYTVIEGAAKLRTLILEHLDLPDVQFLGSLDELQKLDLGDCVVRNGDLSPLDSLRRLRCVHFDNRRHYNRTNSDYPRDCGDFTSPWADPQTHAEIMGHQLVNWPLEG